MSDTVTKANRDINSLQPVAQKAARLFLDECKKRGIPIFVTEYHRSQARQDWLYEQGRTRPGKIVTWTRKSNHTVGYAWDIAVSPPHDLYDANIIARAGQVARELGIEWGGDWKEKDTPHFQVDKNWKQPKDEELIQAVKVLTENKIINSPEAWESVESFQMQYVEMLIENAGKVLFSTYCYDDTISKFAETKISVSPEVWRNKTHSRNHVKGIIINIAKYIKSNVRQ